MSEKFLQIAATNPTACYMVGLQFPSTISSEQRVSYREFKTQQEQLMVEIKKYLRAGKKKANEQCCLFNISLQHIGFVVSFKHHVTGEAWPADDQLRVVYFKYHLTGKAWPADSCLTQEQSDRIVKT